MKRAGLYGVPTGVQENLPHFVLGLKRKERSVTFLCPHEPQISAMHCVALNMIDPSCIVSMMPFDASVNICPPRPGLFLSAGPEFLERGALFPECAPQKLSANFSLDYTGLGQHKVQTCRPKNSSKKCCRAPLDEWGV